MTQEPCCVLVGIVIGCPAEPIAALVDANVIGVASRGILGGQGYENSSPLRSWDVGTNCQNPALRVSLSRQHISTLSSATYPTFPLYQLFCTSTTCCTVNMVPLLGVMCHHWLVVLVSKTYVIGQARLS